MRKSFIESKKKPHKLSLSVHMSVCVCLSVSVFLSHPILKKVTETENFAKQSCQMYFKVT